MSVREKTTVYLGPEYRRLKALAEAEGRPAAELIRDAVADYVRRRAPHAPPASVGAGQSGRGDLSERTEEYLRGMGGEA